jgi:maleamate amidohydrolase
MTLKNDDLTANYVGAFDGRLPFGKRPALLIVDFVMAYLDPASPLYAQVEDALASNERLLAAAEEPQTGASVHQYQLLRERAAELAVASYEESAGLQTAPDGPPRPEMGRAVTPG